MITIKELHFRHPHAPTAVLKGITLRAKRGQLTTILGPNGCGKSTLFKCIAGLWKPEQGEISFGENSILNHSHQQRAKLIAVVPQDHEPPFPYSVIDAVLMGRAAHIGMFSAPSKIDRQAAEKAIEEVGIGHLRDKIYTKISGGERQMVLVARALAQDAPAMLFDEPTSHLDFRNQVLVLRKIREIVAERQVTAVLTIHDPNAAMLFSDSVVLINGGRVVAQGPPHEVITEESLHAVYGIEVVIGRVNGAMVVSPHLEASLGVVQ
ncbi:MAG: ABC-type cobalamin/Fe3+-siderophore transport system ATPase [Desulfobulbaceae bacterium]|nr:MAG: ABC-type cobalamin/Fe3+-siderophore transport system ATPase [Desulfobulbaceae bacterium]